MRLRRLEPVLREALAGPCRAARGSTLLVAVSGGADSTAMLVALASLAREFQLVLVAAHLHHGLRGTDADAALDHVRRLCRSLGVRLLHSRVDALTRMQARGWSGENGLRRLRQGFLLRAAKRAGASRIATAHTADDQLETLLMRMARGAGLHGMGGMKALRPPGWIKPMLRATRFAVIADLEQAGIAWREDASNAERGALRNRIRLDVIPALLTALDPDAPASTLARRRSGLARRAEHSAAEIREAHQGFASQVSQLLLLNQARSAKASLDVPLIQCQPKAIQRQLIARIWSSTGAGQRLTRRHLAALLRLVAAPAEHAEVLLPEGFRARRVKDTLTITRSSAAHPAPPARSRPSEHGITETT